MNYLRITIRIALSLALIYFIYGETGPATAIFASTMLVVCELVGKTAALTNDNLKAIMDIIEGKS